MGMALSFAAIFFRETIEKSHYTSGFAVKKRS